VSCYKAAGRASERCVERDDSWLRRRRSACVKVKRVTLRAARRPPPPVCCCCFPPLMDSCTAVAVPFQHNCHHSVTSVGCRPARDWHSLPAPRPTWPLVLLVTASRPSWPATFTASHCRSAALADFQSTQKSSHLLPICQARALTRIVSVDNCRRIVH